MNGAGQLKVLVVDDAVLPRGMIAKWLEDDASASVATAANGQQALEKLKNFSADVITMDLEMPVMSGYEAIPLIRESWPAAQIIVVSGTSERERSTTFAALRNGAADFIAKQGREGRSDFRREIVEKVKALGRPAAPVRTPPLASAPIQVSAPKTNLRRGKHTLLAIGSSTGGPEAIANFLNGLKGSLQSPVLITQHLPPKFSSVFATNLRRQTGLDCVEAEDGMMVQQRRVYIAPGDRHMLVRRDGPSVRIVIDSGPPENHCRPSVDPMFRSLAEIYGSKVMAVVLTGMGSDGARGAASLADVGARIAVQDQESSVVWGMPGAVANAGLAESILPVPQLSRLVLEHCS